MSWLKYIWASLVGAVVAVVVAAMAEVLSLRLELSPHLERGCPPEGDCGAWAGAGDIAAVFAMCVFIGLFVGTFVGTTVGIAFYRRHLKFKTGQP
jgi:hypothetical protein